MAPVPEKSPLRSAGVGTVANWLKPCCSVKPSALAKKKSRFFTMGPPVPPPNWFRLYSGFWLPSKKLRASTSRLRKYS